MRSSGKRILTLVLAALLTAGSRLPASQAPDSLAAALMRDVGVLAADSMEGRRIGTPGGVRARAYLLRAFAEAGLERTGTGYEQPFEARRDTLIIRGANLVALVRGTVRAERFIVVTAHYDHVGVRNGQVFNGADDNASGTAALLALARWVRRQPLAHSVLFAALDGEEGGLYGARALLAQPPVPVEAMMLNVNLDMVGRNANGELYAAGTFHAPWLRPPLDSVAARAPVRLRFGHDRPGVAGEDDWTTQSDHAAFHQRRIPFVYFGVEDHPDYHRPTDDTERLMPAFFANAVLTIHNALVALDRALGAR